MKELELFDEIRKSDIKSTVFSDGMVVTADDLDTAMRYPIDLFQTLVRAYFGCGIVCGLKVHKYPNQDVETFCVKIEPGVALDCYGHPLQLCDGVEINLAPDPCAFGDPPECVCIAIRRDAMPEAPREDGDDCDDNGKPRAQYRRERELVRIKVFKPEDLPKTLCAHAKTSGDDGLKEVMQVADSVASETQLDRLCECLKSCPDCYCCGEAWVLLACIELGTCGVKEPDSSRRKYIKPIECHCPPKAPAVSAGRTATKPPVSRKKKVASPSADASSD